MSLQRSLFIHIFLCFIHYGQSYDCTSQDTETCYIDRNTSILNDNGQNNITCSPSLSNCIINCNQSESCSNTYIICSEQCTINCDKSRSCFGTTIITNNCMDVVINIGDELNENMNIHSPNNNGILHINNLDNNAEFNNNNIYATSSTKDIIIDCNLGDCSENSIYADSISGDLNITCIGDNNLTCDTNNIYCPSSLSCNIYCDEACSNSTIYSLNGGNDINLVCDTGCEYFTLKCGNNYNSSISWNGKSWEDESQCNIIITGTTLLPSDDTTLVPFLYTTQDDDEDDSKFTILAGILVATIVLCLCIIVVTTIVCCICYHEHQLSAVPPKDYQDNRYKTSLSASPMPPDAYNRQNEKQHINHNNNHNNNVPSNRNNNYHHNNNNNNNNHNNNNNKKRVHFGSQDRGNINNMGYAHPHDPHNDMDDEMEQDNEQERRPHKRNRRKSNDKHKVISTSPTSQSTNPKVISDQDQHNQHNQRHRRRTNSNNKHQQNLSPSNVHRDRTNSKSKSKSKSKSRSKSKSLSKQRQTEREKELERQRQQELERQIERERERIRQLQIEKDRQRKILRAKEQQKFEELKRQKELQRNNKKNRKKNKQKIMTNIQSPPKSLNNINEEEEYEKFTPMGNDPALDKFHGRKENKEAIKIQLEQFPSIISDGTTNTEDMIMVGDNYNMYLPATQNSYFKDKPPKNMLHNDDQKIELGNLDSDLTSNMTDDMVSINDDMVSIDNNNVVVVVSNNTNTPTPKAHNIDMDVNDNYSKHSKHSKNSKNSGYTGNLNQTRVSHKSKGAGHHKNSKSRSKSGKNGKNSKNNGKYSHNNNNNHKKKHKKRSSHSNGIKIVSPHNAQKIKTNRQYRKSSGNGGHHYDDGSSPTVTYTDPHADMDMDNVNDYIAPN